MDLGLLGAPRAFPRPSWPLNPPLYPVWPLNPAALLLLPAGCWGAPPHWWFAGCRCCQDWFGCHCCGGWCHCCGG